MYQKQLISKERVAAHGEVYTSEREVKAMLDLVKSETERVDSRFLEPACGRGNFLIEVLRRKLNMAKKNAMPPRKKSIIPAEYEKQSFIAVSSIYGVDILLDNVLECRKVLFKLWNDFYNDTCNTRPNIDCSEAIKFVIDCNIICGNALSLKKVDEQCKDTDDPIVFSEWTFVTGDRLQRKELRFDMILSGQYEPKILKESTKLGQVDMFTTEKDFINSEGEVLSTYISHYKSIHKNGK